MLKICVGKKLVLYLSHQSINSLTMTQFEQAVKSVREGKLQTPTVSIGEKGIDYFGHQLSVHKYHLSLMAKGMTFRGITFTQIKKYYGLKGRTAAECLPQFEQIFADYKAGKI